MYAAVRKAIIKIFAFGLVSLPGPVAAQALTVKEIQSLPVPELARHVLGPAGASIVDVGRMSTGSLPTGLIFYTRADAALEAGYTGTCTAYRLIVSVDTRGQVTRLTSDPVVGWLGQIIHDDHGAAPHLAQERCHALATTKGFLPVTAGSEQDGADVLIATALLHDSLLSGGPLGVTCGNLFGGRRCDTAPARRELAQDISPDKITSIYRRPADEHQPAEGNCFDVRCPSLSAYPTHSTFAFVRR